MSSQYAESEGRAGSQQKFHSCFQRQVTAVHAKIDRLSDIGLVGGERTDATDHCLAAISGLAADVKDAAVYIPPYDQRSYSQTIKHLTSRLEETRASAAPKAKFSFKSGRKNASAVSPTNASELALQQSATSFGHQTPAFSPSHGSPSDKATDAGLLSPINELQSVDASGPRNRQEENAGTNVIASSDEHLQEISSASISNLTSRHVILPSTAAHAQTSGTVGHVRGCVVDLSNPIKAAQGFASLMLKDVKTSLIVCGHVDGPMHMTKLEKVTIVSNCRQFRMHESRDCIVYLRCSSRPIIENCSNVQFAPLPECYTPKHFEASDNMWDRVDDFNWLKSGPSPNWSIVPPDSRVQERTWIDIIPGGPQNGVTDVLKAAKVPGDIS